MEPGKVRPGIKWLLYAIILAAIVGAAIQLWDQ